MPRRWDPNFPALVAHTDNNRKLADRESDIRMMFALATKKPKIATSAIAFLDTKRGGSAFGPSFRRSVIGVSCTACHTAALRD